MDNIILIGAEDVQRAGHNISSAADRMQSASNCMAETSQRHERYMEEWICRFETAVEKLVEGKSNGNNTQG